MRELSELMKRKAVQIGPTLDYESKVIYINRSAEIGWLIVRLLPFLQITTGAFSFEWEAKRTILDDSFRYMVEALGAGGKRMGKSFVTMLDTNFSFKQPFVYFEADGTG